MAEFREVNYRPDFSPDIQAEEVKHVPTKPPTRPTTILAATPEEEQLSLQDIDGASEMSTDDFLQRVAITKRNALQIARRIDAHMAILESRDHKLTIDNPDMIIKYASVFGYPKGKCTVDAITGQKLICVNPQPFILDTKAMKCVNNIANYNDKQRLSDSIDKDIESGNPPGTEFMENVEEDTEKFFPKLAGFLLLLFKIFAKTFVKSILGIFCGLPVIGFLMTNVGKIAFAIIDCPTILAIPGISNLMPTAALIGIGPIKEIIDMLRKDVPNQKEEPDAERAELLGQLGIDLVNDLNPITCFINKWDSINVDICAETIAPDLDNPYIRSDVSDLMSNAKMSRSKNSCSDKCGKDYVPSLSEIGDMREFVKEVKKQEIRDTNIFDYTFTGLSTADELKNETIVYAAQADGITASLQENDNTPFTIDKVRGNILGIFSVMNETLKGIDMTVSANIHLTFVPPWGRELICCLVRLLYVFLPKIAGGKKGLTDNQKEQLEKLDAFFKGEDEGVFTIQPETEAWIEIIDSVLSYLLGSAEVNIDFEIPTDLSIVMAALEIALVQTMSYATDTLYTKVKDWTTKIRSPEVPGIAAAIEVCEPMNFLFNLLDCEIDGLMLKLREMMASMWVKSNATMESYNMTFEIIIRSRNIKLLKNVLSLIRNVSANLKGFCDLDNTTPQWVADEIVNAAAPTPLGLVSALEPDNATAEKLAQIAMEPIMDPDIMLGPDPDDFINSQMFRSSGDGALGFTIQKSIMYDRFRPTIDEQKEEKVGAVQTSSADAEPLIHPITTCDDTGKNVLREHKSFIREIQENNPINDWFS